MDAVYVLGTGSRWADNELRFSLRSLERYFESLGTVYIVGEYPKWLTGAVHIPYPDEGDHKQLNVIAKLRAAIADERISEKFLLMNDDFFFLRKTKSVPAYSRGPLAEVIRNHPTGSGYYYDSLVRTNFALIQAGIKEPMDYGVHAPIVVTKRGYDEAIAFAKSNESPSLRTVFGNLSRLKPVVVSDFKGGVVTEELVKRPFLSSTDDAVLDRDFRAFLIGKFPELSRFENDEGRGIERAPGLEVGRSGMIVEIVENAGSYVRGDIATLGIEEAQVMIRDGFAKPYEI